MPFTDAFSVTFPQSSLRIFSSLKLPEENYRRPYEKFKMGNGMEDYVTC